MAQHNSGSALTTRIVLLIVGLLVLVGIATGANRIADNNQSKATANPSPSATVSATNSSVTYSGKDGVDALTLLKENHQVEEKSGFVNSIDGMVADNTTVYWEFDINSAMAPAGAGQTITKSTDTIEWKLTPITQY